MNAGDLSLQAELAELRRKLASLEPLRDLLGNLAAFEASVSSWVMAGGAEIGAALATTDPVSHPALQSALAG